MTETLESVSFLLGNEDTVSRMPGLPSLEPFAADILDMLNEVSRFLMTDREAKGYPDVVTFAFWIRKASTLKMKERFLCEDGNFRLGRGTAFHIAPSNVPVNFAYSLAAGLLTGNANIVRVPSKKFPQVEIIVRAFRAALDMEVSVRLRDCVCLVRYGREKKVNDLFSRIADTRIIWGGDATIAEIRKSPLGPRALEVTFADRFSFAVIDSDAYMEMSDKARAAEEFYNDTYLTDQNACTSPRLIVWTGSRKEEAKGEFWKLLHELVRERYEFRPVQAVNKLTDGCLAAAARPGVKIEDHADNLVIRVRVPALWPEMMELKGNSGYFFEYDCDDVTELKPLCDDGRCQTAAYIGNPEMLDPLLRAGVKGIDRVVPVGRTMEFELIWDGYDLYERLTRVVRLL